jgi:hypothetical protein
MLLDRYEPLFFNSNFKEAASDAGWVAYRGELVLQEGEVADAQGRRKPPTEVLKQAILLAAGDDLKLVSGSLDQLQHFSLLMEKLGADLKPDSVVVLYTVNIPDAFVAPVNGCKVVFIPLVQGMVWTELSELCGLEKGDFKGQGAADKVVTLHAALAQEKFKFAEKTVEEALTTTNNAKRENHGAI